MKTITTEEGEWIGDIVNQRLLCRLVGDDRPSIERARITVPIDADYDPSPVELGAATWLDIESDGEIPWRAKLVSRYSRIGPDGAERHFAVYEVRED